MKNNLPKIFYHKYKQFLKDIGIYCGPRIARLFGKYIKSIRVPHDHKYGTVLLIYITYPFRTKGNQRHTNAQEAIAMADVFKDLGYIVDVMDYRNIFYIDMSHYDVIIGFGDVFERAFYDNNRAIKVHYATGAPQSLHCLAEVARIKNLYERKQYKLYPKRIVDRVWPCSEILSDAIISVTDGWAKEQYKKRNANVYSVQLTSLSKVPKNDVILEKKQGNHFVWFGGFGSVHKGLDLCLDAISWRSDFVLHVCGDVKMESDFFSVYVEEFSHRNVKYHGFVDANSDAMSEIMRVASYVILPSCSEGCSTSVLTCMAWGCIPVVTEECGITFPSAVMIENGTVEAVNKAIGLCLKYDLSYRKKIMQDSRDWIMKNHTLINYKSSLTAVLKEILAKNNLQNRVDYN